jgi:hypothetical protein
VPITMDTLLLLLVGKPWCRPHHDRCTGVIETKTDYDAWLAEFLPFNFFRYFVVYGTDVMDKE